MKIGIDNYSYHRYFNEIYPGQKAPQKLWALSDFVAHIQIMIDECIVEGLSIETCFLPDDEKKIIHELSRLKIPLIFQWGHPNGFMDISINQATEQIERFLMLSQRFNNEIIRIVASSIKYYEQPHESQVHRAKKYLEKIIPLSEKYSVKLALENHGDFLLPELQEIIDTFQTPNLGIVADTGNFIRMNENPVEAISLFGKKIYLIHAKDVAIMSGYKDNDPHRFGCVPAGKGVVDFPRVLNRLKIEDYQGMILIEVSRIHPEYESLGEIGLIREGLNYLSSLRKDCQV